ncbi:MAG: SRPBCC domain-containing protein [Bacteroidia bacterium]|nr:SRPBCC domain-containing protein [Bacteroidia bacterium]
MFKQLSILSIITLISSTLMALELKTTIRIEASPEVVWQILTDFDAYPAWNPFIKKLEGEVSLGEKIRVEITDMKFKPKILAFDPRKKLEWIGRFLMPGIVDGRHYFILEDNGDGSTSFIHGEYFKGLLVPFLKKKLMGETRAGFEAMNQALKKRAEAMLSS